MPRLPREMGKEVSTWDSQCVTCAARGRTTRLEVGHVCPVCIQRLTDALRALPQYAEMAALNLIPRAGTGSNAPSYESKSPINCDAIGPELALIELNAGDESSRVCILDCLEMWERAIREDRNLVPFGPASAHRTAQGQSTLVGVVGFLLAQIEWITTEPTFGLEEFADHVHRAARIMRRWDMDAEPVGTMVKCPTILEQGECGYRLYYSQSDEHVTCRRCGAARDVSTLIVVAMSDGRAVWTDSENAARWLGVSESTLRRMAAKGQVERRRGQYLIRQEVGA